MKAKDLVVGSEYHYTTGWGQTQRSVGKLRVIDARPIWRSHYQDGAHVVAEGGKEIRVEVVRRDGSTYETTVLARNIASTWAFHLAEQEVASRVEAERMERVLAERERNSALLAKIEARAGELGVSEDDLLLWSRASLSGDKRSGAVARGHLDVDLRVLARLMGLEL